MIIKIRRIRSSRSTARSGSVAPSMVWPICDSSIPLRPCTAHRTRDEPKTGTRRRFIVSGLLSSTLVITVLGGLRCDPADKVSRSARERLSTSQACVFLLKTSPSPSRQCSTPSKGLRKPDHDAVPSGRSEDAMDLSRRDLFKVSAGVFTGTALGGLAGLGASLAPTLAQAQDLRIKHANAGPSVCPYCSVGCATLVHTVEGKIVNIEGDPRSPHNEGTLCPKGAAIYQLHVNPNRATKVLHRAAGASEWEVWDLDRAMDRVAELVKGTRDETFMERLENGKRVNCTTAIFSLGGATLDNEWNHIQQKLMRGLGVVAIENQARI